MPKPLWQKGQSGNPSGRPKKTPQLLEVEEAARGKSLMAIDRLAYWASSDDPAASVRACTAILDRAWGKPQQVVENKGGENLVLQVVLVERPGAAPGDRAKAVPVQVERVGAR